MSTNKSTRAKMKQMALEIANLGLGGTESFITKFT